MILTSVEIEDFQSIEHVSLDLGEWTSLVGESDVGKSAVIRAIHAALTNRTGDAFIRHGAPDCSVVLALSGGERIEWRKPRGKGAVYALDRPGAEQERFEKTGGAVPEAIASLLRITVDVAGDDLTPGIQRQHDAPFLLADTPRRRAQILGEFDGTNITIRAEGMIRTGQRRAQGAVREAEHALDGLAVRIDQFDPLGDVVDDVAHAESMQAVTRIQRSRIESMGQIAHRITEYDNAADEAWGRAWRLAAVPTTPEADVMAARAQRLTAMRTEGELLRRANRAAYTARTYLTAVPVVEYGPGYEPRTRRLREGDALGRQWRQAQRATGLSVALVGTLEPAREHHARAERLHRGDALMRDIGRNHQVASAVAFTLADLEQQEWAAREALAALDGQPCPTCGQAMRMEA